MVWKILSALAAACLAVAAYFAFINRGLLEEERKLAARAETDLATAKERKKQGDETQKNKLAQLDTLKKEVEDTKAKVAKAAAEAQEKDAALQLAKNTLAGVSQQVDALVKQINEAGDIKKLLAQIDALKKDQLAAEGAVANQTQALAGKQELLAGLQNEINRYRDLQMRASKGVVEPNFTARVASVFRDWGFVILNKGNSGGVFAKADLEVKRGQDVVAKLTVRNVEQQISVADIVPGSLAEGTSLRSGDLVVAAAEQAAAKTAPPATPATPAPGTPAPDGAPATPAPGVGAPNNAVMPSDPFGGGTMPAGAPAAPAPSSDPFATPPAPAAPAPPAGGAPAPSTADPFAPATPPAGGAAPATPPAGGTDPFAPPPPKP